MIDYNEKLKLIQSTYVKKYNHALLSQPLKHILTKQQAVEYFQFIKNKTKNNAWLLQPIDMDIVDDCYVMYYENFSTITLSELINKNPLPLYKVMQIAINIVNAFVSLHQNGEVYEYLNSHTIYVDEQSLNIKLLPSDMLKWLARHDNDLWMLEQTAAIAPEQTGRIVSEVDERTDLYAIGAIIYEMIAGIPVFQTHKNKEITFYILTKEPNWHIIEQKNPFSTLTKLLQMLLAKNKEDRYQTAYGLRYDLQKIMDLLGSQQFDVSFELATKDAATLPKSLSKLYGRTKEIEKITSVYKKVEAGEKQLIYIKGFSGSGKSAMVHSLVQSTFAQNGYYLEYKFDPLKQQQTLNPIINLIRQLLNQIYLEGNRSIKAFRQQMIANNLIVMHSLIKLFPELEWFLNDEISVSKEMNDYTLQQNAYIFSSLKIFMDIFAKNKTPITMFIDDVHLIQKSTLETLERLFAQHSSGNFLLIVAERTEQEYSNDAIKQWIEAVPEVNTIALPLLSKETVIEIVSDTLNERSSVIDDFAEQLYRLTQGNALFIHEAFKMYLYNRTIYFDMNKEKWRYNQRLLKKNFEATGLIHFIEQRFDSLSNEAMEILQMASCFGREFQLIYLLQLSGTSFEQLILLIDELFANGFIVSVGSEFNEKRAPSLVNTQYLQGYKYQFIHDRIQETAYEKLKEDRRLQIHLQISRILQQELDGEKNIIELVRQLNYCKELLTEDERVQLAIWNCQLGEEAKQSGLYMTAIDFYNEGLYLLGDRYWAHKRELMFTIYFNIGECEFLKGNHEIAKNMMNIVLNHAESDLEKLKVYRVMSFVFIEEESMDVGLQAGLQALRLGKIHIPANPTKLHVMKEYLQLKFALRNKSDEDMLNLPPIQNERIQVLIQIMINLCTNSFLKDQNLTALMLMRTIRLQLKYGASKENAIVLINYALMLISGMNNVKGALRFAELAVMIAENQDDLYIKARVYFIYGVFIVQWKSGYAKSIEYNRLAQQYTEQMGMNYITTACSCFLCNSKFAAGDLLSDVEDEVRKQQERFIKYQSFLAKFYLQELQHWLTALKNPQQSLDWNLPISYENDKAVAMMHYSLRLKMAYLFGNDEQIQVALNVLQPINKKVFTLPTTPTYHVFRCLSYLDYIRNRSVLQESITESWKYVEESVQMLKEWAEAAPHQYMHLYYLLLAEHANARFEYDKAELYYDRAIHLSQTNGFIHDEALAYERAAAHYVQVEQHTRVATYINRALRKMRGWGAETIAQRIEKQYIDYIRKDEKTPVQIVSTDMLAFLETGQALANETNLPEMTEKMFLSILKKANATAGSFIRINGERLYIYARLQMKEELFEFKPAEEELPPHLLKLVSYTIQKGEVVMNQQIEEELNSKLISELPHSFCCMPIKVKGTVQGALYLENEMLYSAFYYLPFEILQIIATQMVIAIENAEMYLNLEDRVNARVQEIAQMNVHLSEMNNRLAINEEERKLLLHSISHELRLPISSAIGYIETILDGIVKDPMQQKLYLHRSKERLIALNRLIQDLFDLVKLESGRMEFQLERYSVAEFFELYSSQFAFMEGTDDIITFDVVVGEPRDECVDIDTGRIEQVVSNLLSNAKKYTIKGNIRLSFEAKEDGIYCAVKDDGIGIRQSDLAFVFNTYYKASNTNVKDSHGIGLSICQKIIEKHKGKITIESEEGIGSTFTFMIPYVEDLEVE